MEEDSCSHIAGIDTHLQLRLLDRRVVILGDALDDQGAQRLCQALLLLAADDPDADIRFLINSVGGSVPGMLAIRDCMRAINNDVWTINLGMAYSAGQFLLSSGTPGKRLGMPLSKVLLHQGSAGFAGTAMDIAIQADDLRATRDVVLDCIASDTGQDVRRVEEDSRRDRWFSAKEALDYGFIDGIVSGPADLFPATTRSLSFGAPA